MPCYSASNVRFVSAAAQLNQQCKELNERAKSAYRSQSTSDFNTTRQQINFPSYRSRRCEQFISYDLRNKPTKPKINKKPDIVLLPKELDRLKNISKVVTVEKRIAELKREEEETRRMTEEADRLRSYFKEMDEARNEKLAAEKGISEEVKEKLDDKAKMLNRAFLARQEQEEEVKMVNRMIMDAKCNAIRDAQIHEKQCIAEGLQKEDMRKAREVTERALRELKDEDERGRKERERRAQYAKEIREQLHLRENLRFLEAERVEEEAKLIRKTNELLKEDEELERISVKERKIRFQKELAALRDISQTFKKMLCEQERMADMRIAAYLEEKRKQEQKIKEEQRVAKQEFERKQQRLYTQAEKTLIAKKTIDDLSYLREQDRIEREYRQKEKTAALRKREIERDMLKSRAEQAEETKRRLALQIAQAEADFNLLVQRLKEDESKEKKLDEERACRRKIYRRDLVQQINDKEIERRRLADMECARTQQWLKKERTRDENIKNVIDAKLKSMRENCLPEKYVRDVEKQINKIQKSKNRIVRG